MQLSDGEKLILVMLSDIYEHLGITNSVDPKFVREAIHSGNTWGLKWQYGGIFDPTETPEEVVSEVVEMLSMWSAIELTYKNHLSPEDKARVDAEAKPFDATFRGFDGNNETQHLGAARFLIDELGRWSEIKDRGLNSHAHTLDAYRRMLTAYEPIKSSVADGEITATQIIELLKEQIPPENR